MQANETTEHIDFALRPGGTLSGQIRRESDGTPLGDVIVRVGEFGANRVVATTRSLGDRSYAVDQLPAGRYWVHAGGSNMSLIPEYYDDARTLDEADPVDALPGKSEPVGQHGGRSLIYSMVSRTRET